MASPAQIQANRANALLSTGPATLEGKNAVRLNALKYGIHAESVVIPGEDPEEFQAFVKSKLDTWSPQDAAQQQCVDQLTADSWRLNRLRKAEVQIWDAAMENQTVTLGEALERKSPVLDRLQRMIDRLQRSIRQITRELQRLKALRAKSEEARIASEIAARRNPPKQSQFLTNLERYQAHRDTLEE